MVAEYILRDLKGNAGSATSLETALNGNGLQTSLCNSGPVLRHIMAPEDMTALLGVADSGALRCRCSGMSSIPDPAHAAAKAARVSRRARTASAHGLRTTSARVAHVGGVHMDQCTGGAGCTTPIWAGWEPAPSRSTDREAVRSGHPGAPVGNWAASIWTAGCRSNDPPARPAARMNILNALA